MRKRKVNSLSEQLTRQHAIAIQLRINQLLASRKDLNQKIIAEKLNVSKSLVSRWINEPTNYTLETISKFEELFQEPILNTNPKQYDIKSGYRDYFKKNQVSKKFEINHEINNSSLSDEITYNRENSTVQTVLGNFLVDCGIESDFIMTSYE